MLHPLSDGRIECRCDRCVRALVTVDGPEPRSELEQLGWVEAPPPGLTGRWWCPACKGLPLVVPRRGKRLGRR